MKERGGGGKLACCEKRAGKKFCEPEGHVGPVDEALGAGGYDRAIPGR